MQGDDDDAKAILKRRARYVAMALAGIGTATQATACVCLSPSARIDAPPLDTNDDDARAPIDAERDARLGLDIGPTPDVSPEPDTDVDAD